MTDTDITAPVIDHEAKLKSDLASIEREIRDKQHDVKCLQEEIDDLEIEREELLEQLEETEA